MPTGDSHVATVRWRDGTSTVTSRAELTTELERISGLVDPARPQAVDVQRENGDTLTVVVGGSESVASFVGVSGDPPYFASLGDAEATGLFTFYVGGDHHTEVPRRQAIEPGLALRAAQEFAELQDGLPDCLMWEEV